MRTLLGSLLLVPVLLALVATLVYHASVNAELRFEQRDSNAGYINTARSFRPPVQKEQPKRAAEAKEGADFKDDAVAEEA